MPLRHRREKTTAEIEASSYDNHPEWIAAREAQPRTHCQCCKRPIYTDDQGYTNKGACCLQRGEFAIPDASGDFTSDPQAGENIKARFYLCQICWLTDPDLCAFFNKIGLTSR